MAIVPWIERSWSFDFPVGYHPEMIERLRGAPCRLEERVSGLSTDQLTTRFGETWSIQENAGHLLELESLPAGRLDDFLADDIDTLRGADMSNDATWRADFNSDWTIERICAGFRERRGELIDRLETLPGEAFGVTKLHPRLQQPMRLVDMLLFQATHDDYHLARISELRRRLG